MWLCSHLTSSDIAITSSSSSSSSNLFQSQRSLKSQLKQKQSMLTIIFTGNREEAKCPM